MKKALSLLWQIPVMAISLFVCFIIGTILSGLANSAPTEAGTTPEDAGQAAGLLFLSCLISVITLAFPLKSARWGGIKLSLAVFFLYFGITTFMTQIESIFFNSALEIPADMVSKIFLSGFITALLFAPLAVLIMGKMKSSPTATPSLVLNQLAKQLPLLAIIYMLIYFLFGYFIAWQSPAVRLYYTETDAILPFGKHMMGLVTEDPGLILFQFIRGILWAGLALLIVQMTEGTWIRKGIYIGLLFGVMATGGLLLPNPYMPEDVRWVHLLETSTSNFLFGLICGKILVSRTLK